MAHHGVHVGRAGKVMACPEKRQGNGKTAALWPSRACLAAAEGQALEALRILVRLAGIEPTTLGFGGQYSIH